EAKQFQLQDVVQLSFVDDTNGVTHTMSVGAVRIIDGAFGGFFIDTEPRVIQSLLTRYSSENSIGRQPADAGEHKTSSQLVHKQLERIVLAHIQAAAETLDKALLPELDRQMGQAVSDTVRGQFIDAATTLKQRGAQ